jgi:hypothetical protein
LWRKRMRRKQKKMMKTSSRRRWKPNTQIAKDQEELHPCNSDKIASFQLCLSPTPPHPTKCRVRLTRGAVLGICTLCSQSNWRSLLVQRVKTWYNFLQEKSRTRGPSYVLRCLQTRVVHSSSDRHWKPGRAKGSTILKLQSKRPGLMFRGCEWKISSILEHPLQKVHVPDNSHPNTLTK